MKFPRHFAAFLLLSLLFCSLAFAQNNLHDFTSAAIGGAQSTKLLVSTGVALIGTTPTQIPSAVLTLTASATNYIYVDTVAGTISFNTSGFTATEYPVATAVTDSIHITSLTDDRWGAYAAAGSSAGGTVTSATIAGTSGQLNVAGTCTITTTGTCTISIPSSFYTNASFFPFQSITTTGTSGAATLSGGVLNIPQYPGSGLSGMTATQIPVAATATTVTSSIATSNTTYFPFQSLTTTGSTCASASLSGGVLNIPPCSGGSLPSGTVGQPAINTNGSTGYATSALFTDVSQFAGATVDVQLNKANAQAITNNGGVIDARALGGAQTIAAQVNIGELGPPTLTFTANAGPFANGVIKGSYTLTSPAVSGQTSASQETSVTLSGCGTGCSVTFASPAVAGPVAYSGTATSYSPYLTAVAGNSWTELECAPAANTTIGTNATITAACAGATISKSNKGFAVGLIPPVVGTWASTITDGVSCPLTFYDQATYFGQSAGEGRPFNVTASSSATDVYSLICTDQNPKGGASYYKLDNLAAQDTSGDTMASGAVVTISNFQDASQFSDLHAATFSSGTIACWIWGAGDGSTFPNLQCEGSGVGQPLRIGNTTGNLTQGLTLGPGISAVHPATTLPAIEFYSSIRSVTLAGETYFECDSGDTPTVDVVQIGTHAAITGTVRIDSFTVGTPTQCGSPTAFLYNLAPSSHANTNISIGKTWNGPFTNLAEYPINTALNVTSAASVTYPEIKFDVNNPVTILTAERVDGLLTLAGGATVPSGATLTIASGGTLTCAGGSTCPSGGAYTFDAPIVNTSGTVSLQNSTPANITALTGTDTLIPTNSGAFTSGHSVIADANGGIADSGSANVTAASTTTFTNKSIAGSEVNSGLVASTVGGTGVNNSVTLTLGTTARNYATLGTGFEYNTTTTGAATDATAAQLGALINIAQYDVLVSGGTAAAVAGVAPGSTSGLPFVSQGASSNPTFAALALTALATQTNATFLSNVSGSTAAPSANALPTTANALIKTSNSNGALAASTVSDGGSGVTVGSPTGGAEGAGTLNATGLYINGSAVGTGGPGTGTQYTHPYWSTTSALGSVAPTTGYDGVPQVETNSTTSNVFTAAPVSAPMGVVPNAQTGTTYTYLLTDRAKYVSFSNASSIAVTLPQAGSSGFGVNFVNVSCDIGAGTATITPTTSTISYSTGSAYTSAASTMALTTGQCAWIYSDNTNYFAIQFSGGGGSGANAALSNLSAVSINTALLAQTGVDLGSTTHPFRNLYLFGGGTYGTDSFELTGTSTANRTVTFPDNSGTVGELNLAQTWTALQTFSSASGIAVPAGPVTVGAGSTTGYFQPFCGTAPTGVSTYGTEYCDSSGLFHFLYGTSATGIDVSTLNSATNCSSAASPAVCGSAMAGSVVVAASTSSVVVDTSAVTANSQILITEDSSLGTKLSVTCNTNIFTYVITARTASTSFTLSLGSSPGTNPACFSYQVVN